MYLIELINKLFLHHIKIFWHTLLNPSLLQACTDSEEFLNPLKSLCFAHLSEHKSLL